MRIEGPSRNILSARPLCGDEGTAEEREESIVNYQRMCNSFAFPEQIQYKAKIKYFGHRLHMYANMTLLTVRLASASSNYFHCFGDHALQQLENKISTF